MTPVAGASGGGGSANNRCLYGKDAREGGIIFDSAGGYHVTLRTLSPSSGRVTSRDCWNVVTALVCCKIGSESPTLRGAEDDNIEKAWKVPNRPPPIWQNRRVAMRYKCVLRIMDEF
eukprot:CCRYP_000744-RE/>CCRYP_000744-RE protein AED:0.49 eAED:1.00 QI:0/0/0/1/0/0/2/0/116